jgi:hypothetical protein
MGAPNDPWWTVGGHGACIHWQVFFPVGWHFGSVRVDRVATPNSEPAKMIAVSDT